ncbi:MAG: efflux RND transporter periplasmic adaptor subunit [Kangiellaceae bacterium]|nr:efflux RND transporter periplasmic adaptor subunit [Kangiellaceae bacterium]MCW8998099.1 efflux RND transporter periplasmic adaptor subunit [Kangiellaceae bacterium]MCW9015931.1 efflux RND transporter periplasmic adaptor subunit [Kangiellaceae bacterium]
MNRSIFAIFFTLVFIFSCSDSKESKGPGSGGGRPPAKASPVEVESVKFGLSAAYYVTTATLEPSSDAQVFARTSGIVRQILKEEGDDVKAGDILLLLEDDDQILRVKQARQKLNSNDREYKRLSKMRKAGAVSPTEWEATKTNFETAQTDLELAELALSYTKVSAPFDGRVVWREVDLGAHVLNGNLLFRVMAIDPLLIRVHIPANRIGKVKKGQSVDLKVDSTPEKISGVVELVSPIVDPTTGTVKVTVKIEAYPEGVRPGDFTEVKIVTDSRNNAMLLPSVAVIEERGEHYVFVEDEGKAIRRDVQIGYVVEQQTEILTGLTADDKVIVKGQRNLNDGNRVKVIEPGQQLVQKDAQQGAVGKRPDKIKDAKKSVKGNKKRRES